MRKILLLSLVCAFFLSLHSCATEDNSERFYASRLQYSIDRDYSLLLHNGEIIEVAGNLLILKGDTLSLAEPGSEIVLGQP